jgi:UDP-N-acetylmuramate--alanine ligase
VTNIDLEHLETYKDLDDIKNTFRQFLENIPFYGKAIVCIDDANVRSLLPINHIKTIKYGLSSDADFYATDIELKPDCSTYNVWYKEELLGNVTFNMPGRHNILNSLAAIALALDLEVPFASIAQSLTTFKGIERRFSFRGSYKGSEVFDDYGHHPQEIFNTLLVAKNRTKNNLTVVFQPHRYIRTHALWQDFVDIFAKSSINHLIITDVYGAGETPIPEISGQNLAKAILQRNPSFSVSYAPCDEKFDSIMRHLDAVTAPDDLILCLGAGSKITKLAEKLSA